jgi:dTDP-4-dehydrorhamnose reductase
MNILVLGATGLIGNSIYKHLRKKYCVFGTFNDKKKIMKIKYKKNKLFHFDALNYKKLNYILDKTNPEIVINCIGVTKHIKGLNKKKFLQINSLFPHYAKKISNNKLARFIQISTDCVFNGKKGNYSEKSKPNAVDIYGKSKALGEINDKINLTIRTSTIGHELLTNYGLLNWFFRQESFCEGYYKAIFNGFPTFYFAKILEKILLKQITGILHVSGIKINKYSLLQKIKKIYNKKLVIRKNTTFKIDRTLNNKLFKSYFPKEKKSWNYLINEMKKEHGKNTS